MRSGLKVSKLSLHERRAYQVWHNQKYRCYNKNSKYYNYYGAKGVKVKYSVAEFVKWYIDQFNKLKLKRPSIGRIDHNGNYEFSNIEMIECGENTKEMLKRTGGNKCGAPVVFVHEDKTTVYRSIGYAAKHAGVVSAAVFNRIKRRKPRSSRRRGLNFEIYSMSDFLKEDFGSPSAD